MPLALQIFLSEPMKRQLAITIKHHKLQAVWQQRLLLARLPMVSDLYLGKTINNCQAIAAKNVLNLVLTIEKQVFKWLTKASHVVKSKHFVVNDDFHVGNDDFHVGNDDSNIGNDDFHIVINDFPRENEDFHRKNDDSHMVINDFPRENEDFHIGNDDFHRNAKNCYLVANNNRWHIIGTHCRGSPEYLNTNT